MASVRKEKNMTYIATIEVTGDGNLLHTTDIYFEADSYEEAQEQAEELCEEELECERANEEYISNFETIEASITAIYDGNGKRLPF